MGFSASGPGGHAEGAPKEIVVLREHDPAWLRIGADLAARLRILLGERAIAVEHVGSTAVPGLLAKPIIDLAVGVGDDGPGLVEAMAGDGWIPRGARPDDDGGRVFVRETAPLHRVAHVHVVRHNGSAWLRYLAFRDALRADPAMRDAYARLKRDLAVEHPADRTSYTNGKTGFVLGAAARHDQGVEFEVRRLEAAEWREFRRLRLEALRLEPLAFVERYETSLAESDQWWQQRVQRGAASPSTATFVALHRGQMVAKASGFVDTEEAEPTVHLVGVYVVPAFRGAAAGVSAAVVGAVMRWAGQTGARRVRLFVTEVNGRAEAFYARLGFTRTGATMAYPPDPSITEYEMAAVVSEASGTKG